MNQKPAKPESGLNIHDSTRFAKHAKEANHEAALALWFAFYNFGRVHMTLKTETPAAWKIMSGRFAN